MRLHPTPHLAPMTLFTTDHGPLACKLDFLLHAAGVIGLAMVWLSRGLIATQVTRRTTTDSERDRP